MWMVAGSLLYDHIWNSGYGDTVDDTTYGFLITINTKPDDERYNFLDISYIKISKLKGGHGDGYWRKDSSCSGSL